MRHDAEALWGNKTAPGSKRRDVLGGCDYETGEVAGDRCRETARSAVVVGAGPVQSADGRSASSSSRHLSIKIGVDQVGVHEIRVERPNSAIEARW